MQWILNKFPELKACSSYFCFGQNDARINDKCKFTIEKGMTIREVLTAFAEKQGLTWTSIIFDAPRDLEFWIDGKPESKEIHKGGGGRTLIQFFFR